ASMLDSVGSGAVESLAEYLNDVLCQQGLAAGLAVTNRISPGYADWDVAEQHTLFRLCPGSPVGVTLNAACVMTPGKSISLAAGVFSLMGRLLWPALSEQWGQFMDQLPRLVENVRGWLGIVDYWLGQWGASLPAPKADKVEGIAGILLGNAMRLTTGVVGAVFELLAVLVIAAYLVIDTREIGHTLLALLPREHRATATRLAPAVLNRIGGYVRGQIVSSFFVGVLIAVALALLGVKYALLIGALAAVLNVVPFVGATI